jgi:hypothetical protein
MLLGFVPSLLYASLSPSENGDKVSAWQALAGRRWCDYSLPGGRREAKTGSATLAAAQ